MRKACHCRSTPREALPTVVLLIGRVQNVLGATHRRRKQKKCGPLHVEESARARSREVDDRDDLINAARERAGRKTEVATEEANQTGDEVEETRAKKPDRSWSRAQDGESLHAFGNPARRVDSPGTTGSWMPPSRHPRNPLTPSYLSRDLPAPSRNPRDCRQRGFARRERDPGSYPSWFLRRVLRRDGMYFFEKYNLMSEIKNLKLVKKQHRNVFTERLPKDELEECYEMKFAMKTSVG